MRVYLPGLQRRSRPSGCFGGETGHLLAPRDSSERYTVSDGPNPEGAAVFYDLDAAEEAVESADFDLPWEAHFEVRTDDGEWAENFPESDHPAGHRWW